MRVLHVVSTANRRGAEVFASDLVRLLRRAGTVQHVAVVWGPASAGVSYDAEVTALSAGRRRGWVARAVALRRLMTTWRPDVVHAHGGDALKQSVLARPVRGAPVVYRNIGLAGPWATHGLRRHLYGHLIRRADRVTAVADVVARETVETFGAREARVVTLPNAVDLGRLRPTEGRAAVRRRLEVPDDAPVALVLGSLTWEKDPLGQVEVAAAVISAFPDARFLVAGDGPLAPEVRAAVRRHGLDGRVLLLGSRGDAADLLGAADVLTLGSRSGGMEGMPATVIEAGLAGVPVAAFDVAGVAEVVEHRCTGLLVRPGDHTALAGAVTELFDDDTLRRDLGRRARERCLDRFELGRQVGRYLDLYTEMVAGARPR